MISTLALLYRSRRPLVTITLVVINVAVFIYALSLSGLDRDIFYWRFGLVAAELTSGEELPLLVATSIGVVAVDVSSPVPPWGTVFTSMFLHGGALHILGNMLFLWGFGDKVETRLGHVKYLLFYLVAGVAAAWTQVAWDLDSRSVLIGASGAVSGVIGAYLVAYPYRNTVALLVIFFILPIMFSVGSLGPFSPGAGIATMAHIGGLVAGVLFMAGYKFLTGEPIWPRRPTRQSPY